MKLSDREDRDRAVTRFDRNLVVTAGAGTGKTALLVERALNLIGSGRLDVQDVAAITFTEKAAAELQRRLASGLDELRSLAVRRAVPGSLDRNSEARRSYAWLAGEASQDPSAVASRALVALTELDVASVSTIHAFCAEILRRHPREAMVDPGFAVDEGTGFDRIFEEEWARFLEIELGPEAARSALWKRVLEVHGALDAVRSIGRALGSLLVPDEAVAGGAGYQAASLERLLGGEIRALLETIRDIEARASGMNDNMAAFLESTRLLLTRRLEGGPRGMVDVTGRLSLDEYIGKSKPPEPGRKLAGASPEEVSAAAKRGLTLVRSLAAVSEETIASLVEAALPLAARCRDRYLTAGYLSFNGLLRLTRDMLSRSAEVRRFLAERYRTLLVDEFQDTDPLQYEIVFFLAGVNGDSSSDAYSVPLAPGRLFIVGDPKQSIYRFRGADIEAYDRAVNRILECGGERLTLSASFRSPEGIIEPINRLFAGWMSPGDDTERVLSPPYEPITSARDDPADVEARVEIWSVLSPGHVGDRRSAEAEAIAAWIASDSSSADNGPDYKSYAILLRALTQAGLYAQALRRAGIPFLIEGGRDFYERREVTDLLSFLKAAANPNDGAAVLAVMRGPLGGVPDTELARFAADGGRLDRADGASIDLQPFPGVRRALGILRSFRERMVGRASDDIIRAALTETPLALLHASAFEGAQRVANLRKLVARAGEIARQGLPLERALQVIDEEFQGERSEGESPLADETVNAVRVLSVHKAKGLEYEKVIIPDLGRQPGRSDSDGTAVAWLRPDGGRPAVRLADGTTNVAWVHHRIMNGRHGVAEEKRVFYVACTRARERLILVNSHLGNKAAPWRDALRFVGYAPDDDGDLPADGPLSPGVRHLRIDARGRAPLRAKRVKESAVWAEASRRFLEVSESARASAAPPIRWPTGGGDQRQALASEEVEAWGITSHTIAPHDRPAGGEHEIARLAGTSVHAALERWDFADADGLRELAIEEARRATRDELRRGARGEAVSREVVGQVTEIVDRFLSSSLPARLSGIEVLGREVPILFRDEDGVTWIGAIDLVYRDESGGIVAADYKTDRLRGDASGMVERYRPQMRVYVEALRRALPKTEIRGELLFLREGTVAPIESGASPGKDAPI
jgi:ATP-dependent helicase/nuclease subunit A